MLGIPSAVTPEFLHHFREENLIIPEGEYEEEYFLEAPGSSSRVCYINHDGGLRWLCMYGVLIAKLGAQLPFTHFQVSILQRTEAVPTQLHPNSWAMMRGFEIVCEYLEVPLSPDVFFFLFTLTRPTGDGLTTGWLLFQEHTNRKVFLLYKESFYHFKPMYFKVFGALGSNPF